MPRQQQEEDGEGNLGQQSARWGRQLQLGLEHLRLPGMWQAAAQFRGCLPPCKAGCEGDKRDGEIGRWREDLEAVPCQGLEGRSPEWLGLAWDLMIGGLHLITAMGGAGTGITKHTIT